MPQPPLPELRTAKPFVKWVGGKRSLLPELMKRLPAAFNNYYEPFVGGGALFFALKNEGRINSAGGGQAYLSDINYDLIQTYQLIRRDPEPLIARLKQHARSHAKDYYYETRGQHDLGDPVEIAARFIYLNKTCYNGLWRVNSKGEFNVPMGSSKKPAICQEDNLRACHEALQDVEVRELDFLDIEAGENDFVYFDPPYHPLEGGSFTDYAKTGFREAEQTALRDLCRELHERGAKFMLSNSDTDFIRDLYADASVFRLTTVQAPRMVNCKSDGRGAVNELLISNFIRDASLG
ncbi:MAG: DNA adenine methylase [Chloroflexi bacterium]|nr:DNA adenine methylase [Chloroflexota bacterium]